MEMGQELSQRQDLERTSGILGGLVQNMYSLARNNYDLDTELFDNINNEYVEGKDFFEEGKSRFVVNVDRLPYEINVKAGYISKAGNFEGVPIIELGEIDFKNFGEEIASWNPNFELIGKSVYLPEEHGRVTLINTYTSRISEGGKSYKRTLLKFPKELDESYFSEAGEAADFILDKVKFRMYGDLERSINEISAGHPNMRQEQVLQMNQLIRQEQKPKMTFRHVPAYVIEQGNVIAMATEQLQEHIKKTQEEIDAINRAAYVEIKRKGIAKIKRVKPELSWKQAARVYESLIRK